MIVVKVRDRDIKAVPMGPVTTGSVGLPVRWHFSEEWDDLAKTAVFRVGNDGAEITVAVLEDLCLVPDELLVQANADENLWIGVYGWKGTNANDTIVPEIAMPTIWTYTRIQDGSQPSGIEPPEGTPGWSAQIQNATDEALRVAHGVAADAAEGDFDGISPALTITEITHGHSVTITDRDHPTGQSFNVMDGDSAYEQAVAGGYEGTEAQFNAELAAFKDLSEQAASSAEDASEVAPFYAEYGVTTKAAVVAAINGKRQVYVSGTLGMDYAPLVGTFVYTPLFGEELQTGYRFAIVEGTTQYIYDLADEWSSSTNDLSAPAQAAATSAQAAATTATTFTEQTVPAAVNTINEAKADALTAVGNAQTTAVSAVQTESTTQQAAIQQKGEDVLESIPADYTELTEDVSDLKSAVNAINPPTPTTVKKELGGFIQGSIRTSNGTNLSAANRLRSFGVESYNEFDEVTIEVPEGYTFSVREYSVRSGDASILSANYVGYFPESMTGDPYTFTPVKGHYYRYVLGKSDNGNFTPDDFDVAGFIILAHVASSGDAHPNTLLGNVSIRASKTYMFSDGTQPVTEWWLLQDVNNNFYSTRDFATKKFLFNFVAPTSIVSNWSCGIDANDNVIFVKDAAGYIGKDGARLDDNKRVNPICFLASDNYSEPHIIDFGTAFKPAGWLENLGWCVLPNRDIIMCEYTRGTLATCNVWHINGADITNPNNWSKTWSHAIIDTESPTASGMKHCHCVQYDFFTGICYFSTGDSENGSYIYHSTDNGLTWTLTFGPNKAKCRQLNFVFTADKVYWASDSYEAGNKLFAVAERNANGVIDVENATYITLPVVNNQACYGCVYLQALGLVVMLDRNDANEVVPLTLKAYDIATQTIVTLGQIQPTGTDGHIGFRCKYVDWYPRSEFIRAGFNPRSASIAPDINVMAVCGNEGGYTAGGDGSERINNLSMYIYKIGSNFTIQFDTVDC